MTPEARATQKLLREASTDVLLRTFASLTHLIGAVSDMWSDDDLIDLRLQRDEVKNEILRRTGDLP